MAFSPIAASSEITQKYKRYLHTIFQIKDEDYNKQFEAELNKADLFAKGPYLDIVDSFVKGKSPKDLIAEGVLPRRFVKFSFPMDRTLYYHQEQAVRKSLSGKNIVVSTGTGSGKTEAFLFPILAELSKEEMAGSLGPGVRALIIYPMNALANDQMERLREILANYPEITYGSYTGQTKQNYEHALREYKVLNDNREPKKNELICRDDMIRTPPNILITNYAMLEYLMIRPRDNTFFSGVYGNNWKYIVMDEAHVYSGSTGIEVSMLLRRLRATLNSDSIRYILTSATLGDEDQNSEVAKFAENLCDSPFSADDIIRATRQNLDDRNLQTELRDIAAYRELAHAISDEDDPEIRRHLQRLGAGQAEDLKAAAYDTVIRDANYWLIRRMLLEAPRTVSSLSQRLDCTSEQLADFIKVASYAVKDNTQLLDAKYHMFIKACDSAFITLGKSKKLTLTRSKTVFDQGSEYTWFEISVCNFCHAIYIVGRINSGGFLEQSNLSDDPDSKSIFYLGDAVSDEDEDFSMESENLKAKPFKLCPHCGKLIPLEGKGILGITCEHDSSEYVKVYQIIKTGDVVRKCVACENVNTNGNGVLRSFFAGQEAVTSVIGTALFEELPSYKIIKEKHVAERSEFTFDDEAEEEESTKQEQLSAKQFIAFSDSRQAAAFYASYLNQTYTSILYKRLIVETIKQRGQNCNIDQFAGELQAQFEKYHVLKDASLTYEKEAWKAILSEMVECYSASSLQKLGFFSFTVDPALIPGMKQINISSEEMTDIINVLLNTMFVDAAISYPIPMNQADKEFFTYNAHEGAFSLAGDAKSKKVRAFIPARANGKNKRLDYLQKVLSKKAPEKDITFARGLLENIWKGILTKTDKKILVSNQEGYKVNTESIRIRTDRKFYICPVCKKVTPYNVAGVCPEFKCSGTLTEVDLPKTLKSNHYFRMYQDLEIRGLRAVEHTAQLDREKAYEYQNQFKNKEIDILSCSTTFEMGVDVGSLETVFMRNMPPSPANYAQRAGRAGRSIKAVAYALTFCNKGNHDFTFFNNPESMIRGKIKPPIFKVENEKIAIRHVFASSLGKFWKEKPEYFSDAETLIEKPDNGYTAIIDYLQEKPSELRSYLCDFLPSILRERFGIDKYEWVDNLIGEEGALTRAKKDYEHEVGLLQASMSKIVEGKAAGSYDYLKRRLNNYQKEGVIPFLSRRNVLPKYGFPVDTVELSVYDNKGSGRLNLDLSRDLSMAISEYAPGSQVVADGNLITSQYLRRMPNMDWKRYDYCYCTCKTLNIETHVDSPDDQHLSTCKVCGHSLKDEPHGVFIVPEFGFEAGKIEKAKLIKPKRTYNSETAYVGYKNNIEFQRFIRNNRNYCIAFSQGDEMAVINRSNFFVCETCGYTHLSEKNFRSVAEVEHHFSSGGKCPNKILKKFALGYKFDTDVIQIQFCWPQITRYEQALSILYGIMRGVCISLNIEDSDISGTVQYFHNDLTNTGSYQIVLFDRTPGGAGHVKRLNDEKVFLNALKTSLKLVESCSCGGERKDTSCYNCLRSYGNQKYHDYLERRYVIDFLQCFFDDKLGEPVVWENVDQGTDVVSTFSRLIMKYGLILSESKQFRALLKEYLKTFSKQGEAIVTIYDAGVIDDILRVDRITSDVIDNAVTRIGALTDLDPSLIRWAVELWMSVYGETLLGKKGE